MIRSFEWLAGLVLAALGAFSTNSSVAEGLDNSKPLVVVDANGTVVGRLNGESVITEINGARVQLLLEERLVDHALGLHWTGKLRAGGRYPLLFQSDDCSGPAYLPQHTEPRPFGTMPAALLRYQDSHRLYVGHSTMMVLMGPFNSFMETDFGPTRCKSRSIEGQQNVWALDAPVDLGAMYALPLHIE